MSYLSTVQCQGRVCGTLILGCTSRLKKQALQNVLIAAVNITLLINLGSSKVYMRYFAESLTL